MRATQLLPLLAVAHACAAAPVAPVAAPFPLGEVRLLDGPFKAAMERNASYLLMLEPDRLLHNTRQYAGLPPKAEAYGGWEHFGIAGHTLGHYLSALSQQYAATGDRRFRARIDYIVGEMALCQRAYGDGYIGALPPLELRTMRDFKRGVVEPADSATFKGGAWVPWYTEHKVLKGLTDAWALAGCTQARDVALRLADWTDSITAGLSHDQLQSMLRVEQGGMMDVLVELYALTGDARYLGVSRRFYHEAVLNPLLQGRDDLVGKHANTQIPKVIGEARTYEETGEPGARAVADTFWSLVVHHHSYVIGGDSENEHFFAEEKTAEHLGADTAETCNTYNMLKLTEHVFGWNPRVECADFYERALYNHILASQDPQMGMFTYFMSLKPGLFKTYSTPFNSFWCCVGTGMENHTKYGEAIYFHGRNDLYVNLYIPSVLSWRERGFELEQRTGYPRTGETTLTVKSAGSEPVLIRFRCPGWAAGPVTFTLNGRRLGAAGVPGTYAAIGAAWKRGDRIVATIPMEVRAEAMPGNADKVAFLYGPAVLAADLGPAPFAETVPYSGDQTANLRLAAVPAPVLIRNDAPLAEAIVRSRGEPLAFHTEGVARPKDVVLRPFWEISYDRYTVYWDVVSDAEWMYRSALAQKAH